MKLFGFLSKLTAAKAAAEEFFAALGFLMQIRDRIDDDLDGNGKSELEDILDTVNEIEDKTVAFGKELIRDVHSIVKRALALQAHVLKGGDK